MRVLSALLLGIWLHGVAASEVREFANPDQQQRYETLVKDLRCLVCQNQSLADSDADLAKDLRDEVYDIIRSGKTDQEAVKFLVDRYGDFVLYRPPFSSLTLLLWLGPALLLLIGLLFIWRRSRHQDEVAAAELTPAERARLEELRKNPHG
jgi:cytochrome c-type biogenesis protein CcmH